MDQAGHIRGPGREGLVLPGSLPRSAQCEIFFPQYKSLLPAEQTVSIETISAQALQLSCHHKSWYPLPFFAEVAFNRPHQFKDLFSPTANV